MPWKTRSCVELRVEFVVRAERGENISSLSREFGVSRTTAYKWLNRFSQEGSVRSLLDRSRRPHHSPHKIPESLEKHICSRREEFGWGARKLRELLKKDGHDVPESTIKRVLKRNNLLLAEGSHCPAPQRFERSSPNEMWQVDFKGPIGIGEARCEPLSIIDDHSRYLVSLKAVRSKQIPEIRAAFTQVFENYGIPESILLDHGTPWWNSSNYLGLSQFSVWLMKQDLRLLFSRVRHPQTQGKVERFHRSLALAIRHQGTPRRFSEWKYVLPRIQFDYNYIRPHEALGMSPPASRYNKSRNAYNPSPRPFEYPEGATVMKVGSNGQFIYRKKQLFVSRALSDEYVRIEEIQDLLLVFYRNSIVREISLLTGKSNPPVPFERFTP